MNALLRKKKVWEYRNERTFLRLVETSADVTVESAKKAGQITSFLLFMVYRTPRILLAITRWTLLNPRLQRYSNPVTPAEAVEPTLQSLEAKLKNPILLR